MAGRSVWASTKGRAMATKNESAEIGTVKPKCGKLIFPPGGYYGAPCGKTATYEDRGAHYCKTHHPPTVEAKRAASYAKIVDKLHGQISASKAAADELAAMRKDAARYLKWRACHMSCLSGGHGLDMLIAISDAKQPTDVDAAIDAEMAKHSA